MTGSAMRSSWRAFGAGALALAVGVLGFALAGCGAGGGEASTGTAPSGSSASAEITGSRESSREKARSAAEDSSPQSHDGKAAAESPGAGAEEPAPGHDAAARRRAARACPDGLTLSQCKALVEEIEQAKHSGSPSVENPRDCMEVMSRSECEAMLAAQQAAARQEGSPIHLEDCLQHPTPRCRAALESVLEAQYAASQQAAK